MNGWVGGWVRLVEMSSALCSKRKRGRGEEGGALRRGGVHVIHSNSSQSIPIHPNPSMAILSTHPSTPLWMSFDSSTRRSMGISGRAHSLTHPSIHPLIHPSVHPYFSRPIEARTTPRDVILIVIVKLASTSATRAWADVRSMVARIRTQVHT